METTDEEEKTPAQIEQQKAAEEVNVQEAYVLNLSSIRMNQTQVTDLAESEINKAIDAIQGKFGVLSGDLACHFFSPGTTQKTFENYINEERKSSFSDLMFDYDEQEQQEKWDKLNKLVLVRQPGHQIVGSINDVMTTLTAAHGIEYSINDKELTVSRKGSNGVHQILFESSCTDFNSWSSKGAVHLLEAKIITENLLLQELMWEQSRLSDEHEDLAYLDYVLDNKVWVTEHKLCEHEMTARTVKMDVHNNPLQFLSGFVLEDEERLQLLAKIGGVKSDRVPVVKDDDIVMFIDLPKLSLEQRVFIVQSCIDNKNVAFAGDGLNLLKASVAGSVQDFDDVAFANQQVLDPGIVDPKTLAATPTVNLDW